MRFAYADPPYIGCASYYPEKTEVYHPDLIARLVDEFPDGWALSCLPATLRLLLPCCPDDVRIMAWVKPFAVFKPGVTVAYAWESVLVRGGRPRARTQPTVRDWCAASVTLQRGLIGAKPDAFCRWLLEVLNVQDDDELVDLYPGTGTLAQVRRQGRLFV